MGTIRFLEGRNACLEPIGMLVLQASFSYTRTLSMTD